MPTLEQTDLGNGTTLLTISIGHDDYAKTLKKELFSHQKRSNFRGFRKGKAPMSFVKKMYGQRTLYKVLSEIVEVELSQFIGDQDIFGQPIPVEEKKLVLSVNAKKSYTFKFKVGFIPDFEIPNFFDLTFEKYRIVFADAAIDKVVEDLRSRNGVLTHPEDKIEIKDTIKVKLEELEADETGDVKEGGLVKETTLAVDLIKSPLQDEVLTLAVGDSFVANIYDLDSAPPEQVRKYVLGLKDTDDSISFNESFRVTVLEVNHQVLAELNTDFYDKVLGAGEAVSFQEFRGIIEEEMAKQYDYNINKRLQDSVQKKLVAIVPLKLPEAFIKEWMVSISKESKDRKEMTLEEASKSYENSAEVFKWTFIKNKIVAQYNLQVKQEELMMIAKSELAQYYGTDDKVLTEKVLAHMHDKEHGEDFIQSIVQKVLDIKVLELASMQATIQEKNIYADEFNEMLQKEQQEQLMKQIKAAQAKKDAEDAQDKLKEATVKEEQELTEAVEVNEKALEEKTEQTSEVIEQTTAEIETIVETVETEMKEIVEAVEVTTQAVEKALEKQPKE